MKFTESQLDFMRQDLSSNFALSNLIEITKKKFADEGRDFDKEFEAWKKNKETRRNLNA